MPWRRARKRIERPIDVSRSIEESLEDAAEGEEEEDLTELGELDGASDTEAATAEPDEDRAPTELGTKLRDALEEEPHRGGLPHSAPLGIALQRSSGAARSEGPHAASYPEASVDLSVEAARGLRLKNPVMTASGTFGQGVEYAELRPGLPVFARDLSRAGILEADRIENA